MRVAIDIVLVVLNNEVKILERAEVEAVPSRAMGEG
jgi:hypothetical protein